MEVGPVRFGIVQEAYFPPGTTLQQRYWDMVEEAVHAEKCGFDFYCTSEQHFGYSEAYLTERADKEWTLTAASDPASTKDVPATDAELRDAGRKVPGAQTFRLVSAGPFKPESHRGQTVHVKGIINRLQPDVLLNVTALQPLGGACGN